jgi:hypothetical protein
MGYTHYWTPPKKMSARKFKAASDDCRKLCEHLHRSNGPALREDSDETSEPLFDRDIVKLNGVGEDGHETFVVVREAPDLTFCKTARKPYDLAVCACLIIFRHHIGEKFEVSSDGDDDEENWPAARAICQHLFGYGSEFELINRQNFGRMSVHGIPMRKSVFDNERDIYVLANGWAIRTFNRFDRLCHRHGGRGFGNARLYKDSHKANATPLSTNDFPDAPAFRTVRSAQHYATIRWLYEKFIDLPEAQQFLDAFRDTFDWAGLAVYADRLAEFGKAKAERKLRAMLPRCVATT